MNITVRTLSPALIGACLAMPLLAEHEKPESSTGVHANIPAHVLRGDEMAHQTLGQVARVSDVIGLEVKNLQGEKLGKVNDLAVDVASGRIVEVIVSTGGVLGVGSTLIGVPPAAFQYDHEAKVLQLNQTRDSLKEMPAFDLATWDAHFQSTNVATVYRAYGVNPYFSEGGVAADNTALNRRDRDGKTLTPIDQGNSASDIAITATVRKAVLDRDGLSINAQNVKIITRNGRVTLRGPVNSREEMRVIGDIAAGVVPASDVDNQLEVKGNVSSN